ncbi:pirin family protein [Bacteroides graminisolvens]|jgi:redox-sensitive bicupin YhaK (pirin superfamily)|uniref:pirin family protein n=1 Tax=Bacteroides graminisolvens TaxID=477666 RepID=UPI000406E050|nr:pirin family protein [Bacteroides graminisolvens]MBP6249341.1 pirin family protein [Bacteroides sp.]MBP9721366.1 pirin family protein [Bacteroides sp.]
MKTIIDRSNKRGHSLYEWLDSYHSFSFGNYYNPEKMGFGALRVLNDDIIAPETGFDTHPHKNMEIVTIPLKGELKHGDSKMNERIITPGDIQVMSAGTGIYHSESNPHGSVNAEILQIWILPHTRNTEPNYNDYNIRELLKPNELTTLVAPDGSAPGTLLQQAWFSMGTFDAGQDFSYSLHNKQNGIYVFVIEGEAQIENTTLNRRDAMGIYDVDQVKIASKKKSHLLVIEVPL